jgi:hypothetical protein
VGGGGGVGGGSGGCGGYVIEGNGVNKFGSFTLKGTLSDDGDLHLYREYYKLNSPLLNKRRLSGGVEGEEKKKRANVGRPPLSLQPIGLPKTADAGAGAGEDMGPASAPARYGGTEGAMVSPRDGSGRVRKQSVAMLEYQDRTPKAAPTPRNNTHNSNGFGSNNTDHTSNNSHNGNNSKGAAPAPSARQERQESSAPDRSQVWCNMYHNNRHNHTQLYTIY